jgi:hypothetical protein
MAEDYLLQGSVKWSYDYELSNVSDDYKRINGMMSFSPPLHHHEGNIALTESGLIIEGNNDDLDLDIKLSAIMQIYLGFDEHFTASSIRSRGILWQPLRIQYSNSGMQSEFIYLVIDFNGLYTRNKKWYNAIIELLQ